MRCRAYAASGCGRQPLRVDIINPIMTMRNFSIQYTQQRQGQITNLQLPTKPVFGSLRACLLRGPMRRHFAARTRGGIVACDLPLFGPADQWWEHRMSVSRGLDGVSPKTTALVGIQAATACTFQSVRAASNIFSRLSTSGENRRECGIV